MAATTFVFGATWTIGVDTPSFVLEFHLIADPFGPKTFVLFIPKAFLVRNIRMAATTFVFSATWTIGVYTLGRVARFGAATASIAGFAARGLLARFDAGR